jgi:PKD repeat protein
MLEFDIEANSGTYTNTFLMNFAVGLIVEDWETGDFSQFEWETGGNSNWNITNAAPYEGTFCAKSGNIDDNESSYLSISYNVLANGVISFFKKVSSESTYDFLKFYIDDNLQDSWSGEVAWSESSYPVTSGQHTFKWEYTKDVSVFTGSDCGWVDYIILPSGATQGLIAFFTADQTEICEGGLVNFTDYSSGNITSWNWSFPSGTPSTSTLQNPSVTYNTSGIYDVTLTISNGSDSQTLTLENYIAVITVPPTPEIPNGNTWPESMPYMQYEYTITEVINAENYEWIAEPVDAIESLVNNGSSCIIDFTDWYWGNVILKVKAIDDCGESEFSDELTLFVTCESVNENYHNKFIITPNPSDGLINISFEYSGEETIDIRILNTLGKIIYREDVTLRDNSRSFQVDLRSAEAGVYFVVVSQNEYKSTYKMIIR